MRNDTPYYNCTTPEDYKLLMSRWAMNNMPESEREALKSGGKLVVMNEWLENKGWTR